MAWFFQETLFLIVLQMLSPSFNSAKLRLEANYGINNNLDVLDTTW